MTNLITSYAGAIPTQDPPPIDEALVERFTGQRAVRTVQAAEAGLATATSDLAAAQTRLQRAQVRAASAKRRCNLTALAKFFVATPAAVRVEPWVFLLVLTATVSLAFGIIVGVALGAGALAATLAVLIPAGALMALLPAFTPAGVQRIRRWSIEADTARQAADAELGPVKAATEAALRHHATAVQIRQGLIQAREFPLARLLAVEFRLLSGSQFEDYLAEVFRFLGYSVQQTGKSGDQGVDLIVTRGGVSTAVQAKCYGGSVGNSAVQQVFAGMQFYKCQRCAVVASAHFTSGATELAAAVDCRLIALDDIRGLVRGELVL